MADNRERLEDIAQQHVQRGGLKSLSFRTLAEHAGIKSSSVHYYFPEKSDLGDALIERYRSSLMAELESISSQGTWSLRRKLTALIAIFEAVSNEGRVCLCGMLAAEFDNLSDSNRLQLTVFFEDMEKWFSAVLNAHKEELNSTLPSAQLAKATIAGLEGALLIDRVAGNKQRLQAQKALIFNLLR